MKRDLELLREIVARAEAAEIGDVVRSDGFPGRRGQDVAAHMLLLKEAGLVDAAFTHVRGFPVPPVGEVYRLTHQGHDFLDAARDEDVWERLRTELARGRHLPLSVVFKLLLTYSEQQLGLADPGPETARRNEPD